MAVAGREAVAFWPGQGARASFRDGKVRAIVNGGATATGLDGAFRASARRPPRKRDSGDGPEPVVGRERMNRGISRRQLLHAVGAAGGASAVHAAATALGLLPAVARAGQLGLRPAGDRARHVVVIGAGIAGLTAAYELRRAGHRCTVLEASHRPGGRSLTLRRGDVVDELGARQVCTFDDQPHLYFNAGPARIPATHASLLHYCRELDVALEIFVNDNRNAWVHDDDAFDGQPIRNREYRTDARGFLAELLAKSVDPRALDARLDADDRERLREFARAYGDLDDTLAYRGSDRAGYASGGITSPGVRKPVRDFSALLRADFWREYMHWGELADQVAPMLQPVGGMDRIVDGFMRRVGDAVELRAAVREIRLQETGVEVAYTGADGEVRAVRADYCLNSMPAHLVTGLRHNLPARYVRALSAPGRGRLVKLAFQARRRFWEDEQIYGGISWTSQDITQIWYPPHGIHSGSGIVLGAYAFEDAPGTRLTRLSPAERIEAALAQGEKIHPDYRQHVEHGISVAWYRMNHVLGCSTLWSDEAMRDHFPTLQGPTGRHYMVGDQISHHPGWQEGAIQSAYHALRDIDRREREARDAG
jgi:monoamine oxidase